MNEEAPHLQLVFVQREYTQFYNKYTYGNGKQNSRMYSRGTYNSMLHLFLLLQIKSLPISNYQVSMYIYWIDEYMRVPVGFTRVARLSKLRIYFDIKARDFEKDWRREKQQFQEFDTHAISFQISHAFESRVRIIELGIWKGKSSSCLWKNTKRKIIFAQIFLIQYFLYIYFLVLSFLLARFNPWPKTLGNNTRWF